jgi:nucleotidyltransferase/DNA polymerase involved in DNA repair
MSVSNNTPVHFLPGIGKRTASVLHGLGIHTAGQLAQMPDKVLIELFGPSIRSVLHFVAGKQQRTMRAGASADMSREHQPMKKSFLKRLQLASQFVSML